MLHLDGPTHSVLALTLPSFLLRRQPIRATSLINLSIPRKEASKRQQKVTSAPSGPCSRAQLSSLLLVGSIASPVSRAGRPSGEDRSGSHKSSPLTSAGSASGSRTQRRNAAKQAQLSKRAALVASTRVFGAGVTAKGAAAQAGGISGNSGAGAGLGKGIARTGGGAPRICAVIDLAEDGDSWEAVRMLQEEGEEGGIRPVEGCSVEQARKEGRAWCELE